MDERLNRAHTLIIFGAVLVAAPSAQAQQGTALGTPDQPSTGIGQLAPQPLAGGGGGGYGAAQLFSPFPAAGALQPPSLQVPGLTPSVEAPREFAVTLGLGGNEQWTDNVFLTSSNIKPDFITSVDPSVAVDLDSRRIKGGLHYDLGYDIYASNSRMNGFRNDGIGLLDAELLENRLFLDSRASVSEQNINQTGAISSGTRTGANNLALVTTTSIAPRLQQRFGDWALGQISYHNDMTRSQNASQANQMAQTGNPLLSTNSLSDSHTNGGRLEVRSGETFSALLWDYSGEVNTSSSNGNTYHQVSHTVGSEYRLNSDLGLLASVGDDYLHASSFDLSKYGGVFYNVGLHWTPSPNTDLRVGIGHRYDKMNLSLLAEHHFSPMTLVRLSENSGVTTDALSFEQALNTVQRDESGGFINPFSGLAANPSLSPFSWSSAIYWQRITNLVLRHDEERDSFALTAQVAEQKMLGGSQTLNSSPFAGGVNSGSTTVVGGNLSWMHHFTPAVSGQASVAQSNTLASDNSIGGVKQFQGNLGLNNSLNPTLVGTLGYRYAVTMPESSASIRENMISIGLRKTF